MDKWKRLGAYVAERRASLGLQIKDAAEAADISDTRWRQLEQGIARNRGGELVEPNPRRDLLGRVAIVLKTTLATLDAVLNDEQPATSGTPWDDLSEDGLPGSVGPCRSRRGR